ncbi:MAG: hypothetical protein J5882_06870 [Bacteroidales bacterium]|nr:hypothetical protein [Bacteroidales bacterium]
MGKTNYGFTGCFSGRLGNVVGYQWRGKWCVRSLPKQYRDAKTEPQLAQRALFKAEVGFAARAQRVLKIGLNKASLNAQMFENNYFMRINKRCFEIVDGVLAVDYANLIVSEGPVAPVAFAVPRLVDETTLHIDFEKNPLRRVAKSEDLVYIAAYSPELKAFDISTPYYRHRGYAELHLPPLWAGREVHLWGFVVDGAGRASTSQYLGCGILDAAQWPDEETDNEDDIIEGLSQQSNTENTVQNNSADYKMKVYTANRTTQHTPM